MNPIGYELKENGYPTLEYADIHKNCESLLDGNSKIDGKYVADLIKKSKSKKNEKSI